MALHEAREGPVAGSTQLAGPAEMLSIDNICWPASLLSNLKHMGDLMINASTMGLQAGPESAVSEEFSRIGSKSLGGGQ